MSTTDILPPGEYITRDNVFVLDPHTLRDKDGNTIVDVTEDMLQRIAANQNKRIKATGDLTPIVIGHTRDDQDEKSAPEIVGYASNYRVRKFFRTGKRALACTFHVFKKKADEVRRFPRRSVELWLGSLTIDPISLLGATTPERDLGLLRLSKGGDSKLVATRDDAGELSVDENTQSIVDAVVQAIKATDVWQYMEKKMGEEGAQAESQAGAGDDSLLGGDAGGAPDNGEFDPQGDQSVLDALGGEPGAGGEMPAGDAGADAGGVPGDDEDPMKMSAMASGGNTFVPGGVPGDKKQQYARSSDEKLRYARLERENTEMRATLNHLVLRYRKAEREKDLMALEQEGYLLDRNDELNLAEAFDDKQWQAHCARIKVRYQRAPMSPGGTILEHSALPGRGRSSADARSVVDFALERGISYADALEQLNGNTTKTY